MKGDGKLGVLSLSWPIFFQLLFMHAIGLVDIYILSRISDEASASVGAVNTVMTFVLMMFSFLGQGGSLVYAQCLGAGRRSEAENYRVAAVLLHLGTGVVTSLLLFGFAPDVAGLLGLRGVHLEYGSAYLRIVGGTVFVYSLVAMLAGVMSAHGHTRHTMAVSVVTNLVNVAALYVIVLSPAGPRWGVTGAAACTAFAAVVGLVYNMWLIVSRLKIRIWRPRPLASLVPDMRVLLRYAVPTTVEPMLWQAAQIVSTIIITKLGPEALAARIYTLSITNMIGMFSNALAQGCQIVIGHLVGAGRLLQVRATHRWTMGWGLAIAIALSGVAGLSGDWIMRRFSDDPEIISTGRLLLVFGLLYLPASSVIMTTAGSLRAVGHVRYPAYVGVLVLWGVFLPLAYVFAFPVGLGIVGVMLAMGGDENLRAALLYRRWRYLSKPSRRDLLLTHSVAMSGIALRPS